MVYTALKQKIANRKTKVLIGTLIIGIVLIGGWWVWNKTNKFNKYQEIGIICMPKTCCTLYCEKNNSKNCNGWNAFAKVCRPPSPSYPGGTLYYIQGKIVTKDEYS